MGRDRGDGGSDLVRRSARALTLTLTLSLTVTLTRYFPPVCYDGDKYFDGGFVSNNPAAIALRLAKHLLLEA